MKHRNLTDETLVMLTLAGDSHAYEALVSRHQGTVLASALRVTHTRFMAEDAAQDAFVTAWMKLNTLNQPEKFCGWVCRIARNCALNMVTRYRSFVDFDSLSNTELFSDMSENPAELCASAEETNRLHDGLKKLPKRVGEIIRLHYFDGLSVAEIADRMQISEGTVKWQLHDGRRRIRKELCAMDEKCDDVLVARVMKKVEELKLWQVRKERSGFEDVYESVLREVEKLPESDKKYSALADVLMRGWWWLPGEKNDALFTRIREAAILGHNDEVMEFIVDREDRNYYGHLRLEFIRDKQIPYLEKEGFIRALGLEWFKLGRIYAAKGEAELANAAYDKASEIFKPCHLYRSMIPNAKWMDDRQKGALSTTEKNRYSMTICANELRMINGRLTHWADAVNGEGYLQSFNSAMETVLSEISQCDGQFYREDLSVGETYTGSDKSTLTFLSASDTVITPAGSFDRCQVWETKYISWRGPCVCRAYYKDGIGIVRLEHENDGQTDVRVLKSYDILGGKGLLPLAAGNTWEYGDEYAEGSLISSLSLAVTHADTESMIVASRSFVERLAYSEDSWLDKIELVRNEYHGEDGDKTWIRDVSHAADRAIELAETPVQRVHAKAAAKVFRRIMDTEPENLNRSADGIWNFFEKYGLRSDGNRLLADRSSRFSFEWKRYAEEYQYPLLHNDIYGILSDAANCLWNEEWKHNTDFTVEYMRGTMGSPKTTIICREVGDVTTAAGCFKNCIAVHLKTEGLERGWKYRGGDMTYYFALGIGIVKTEHDYCEGAKKSVYELTEYRGIGEGYMPVADGLFRRYEAKGLTDGLVGEAEYTYVADRNAISVFVNRTGVQQLLPSITRYNIVSGERKEEALWEEGKHAESRVQHGVNNFLLFLHMLGRVNRNWGSARHGAEWGKYQIRLLDTLAVNGKLPRAWLGRYWRACFAAACALFGCDTPEDKEEGYRYLEKAFEAYPAWAAIPDGEELEVGNPYLWGGVKLIKGKDLLILPDGTRDHLQYGYLFRQSKDDMYYGMTASHGWEWFNPVREEERFKTYVERAKRLMES